MATEKRFVFLIWLLKKKNYHDTVIKKYFNFFTTKIIYIATEKYPKLE